jgi:hypothetical protein
MNTTVLPILPILNSSVSGGATADGVIFEKLRSKVVEAFVALLPEETINKLLEDEIKAFFELQERVYVETNTVTMSRKEAISKGYDFAEESTWDRSPTSKVRVKQIGMVTPMSPFRHLVWHELGTVLQVKIKTVIQDQASGFNIKLDKWFKDEAESEMQNLTTVNFNALSMMLAKQNQYEGMVTAAKIAGSIIDTAFGPRLTNDTGGQSGTTIANNLIATLRGKEMLGRGGF